MTNSALKRGDTFRIGVTTSLTAGGAPLDLTGYVLRSQVRRGTTLVHTLTVEQLVGPAGTFQLVALGPGPGPTVAGATDDWPVGTLLCDIEYTDTAGDVVSTETFTIEVVADITR